MFTIPCHVTDEDYLDFQYHHMNQTKLDKKTAWIFRLTGPVVVAIVLLLFWIAGADKVLLLLEAVVLTIFAIIWLIRWKQLMMRSLRKKLQKQAKTNQRPYCSQSTYQFEEDVFIVSDGETEIKSAYSTILQAFVTETALYLYVSPTNAFILPLHHFTGTAQRSEFLTWLKSKLGEDKWA